MPLMKHHGWGRIVNFSSGSVHAGGQGQTQHVAAKAVSLTLRAPWRELGDRERCRPGADAAQGRYRQPVLDAQMQRRATDVSRPPGDLVGPVFFLASPDAAFMTGQTLSAEGGVFMSCAILSAGRS